ncbi:UNVERIFIED_CONTAM: Proton pump-interactor 1 [Sesamum radiatum]|uniref:Proton pump-interactor 1 n=1 Tax=Sesamum radiatum TaxID=300843 RepID=A0AAW2KI52_SESRA
MGVEVVDSNLPVIETGNEANVSVVNEKVNIKFGSHVVDEPVKGEANKVSESNLPKDAVDEWPEPKQIHSFYIVRYRALEDQKLKAKLDVAEKELQKKNQARSQIVEKIRAKRVSYGNFYFVGYWFSRIDLKLRWVTARSACIDIGYRCFIRQADRSQLIAQIRSLSVENKQFRTIMDEKRKEMEPLQQALGKLRGTSGGRDRVRIKSLQYRIQHESIPLSEEKQILREIKQLEGTREKVIANAAERARIQDSLGEKNHITMSFQLIGNDLDGVRKEKQVIHAKLKQLDEEKLALEKEISVLEGELTAITEKRDKTFETIKEMRKQREDGNSPFYQNRMLLTKAKAIAANKDVDALKELSDTELSKDGRLRNPGEKPLVQPETSTTSEAEVVKTSAKQTPKENAVSAAHVDASSEQKVQKTKGAKNNKEGNKKTETTLEKIDKADEEEFFTAVKSQKESLPKRDEEREKRARKKNGAAVPAEESEESTEAVAEVAETEVEDKIETPAPQKNRDRKENTIRHRGRPRGQDSLPKAILKRKKATNYWIWAAPAALVILVLLLVGYNYLS